MQENNYYCQMTDRSMKERMLLGEYRIANHIMIVLTTSMKRYNKVIISAKTIAEKISEYCGPVSERSIQRGIKWLKENNYINVKKCGTSNVYIINDEIYWKGPSEDRKFCEFEAHVVLSASENNEESSDLSSDNIAPETFDYLRGLE